MKLIRKKFMGTTCRSETMNKTRSKYIPAFDYFDKTLILLSATSSDVSIALFGTVINAQVGIISTSIKSEIAKKVFEKNGIKTQETIVLVA